MNSMHYNSRGYMQPIKSDCGCGRDNMPDYVETITSPLPNNMSVAMAYVPFQDDTSVYDDLKALECGTLFPQLNLPYTAAGGYR